MSPSRGHFYPNSDDWRTLLAVTAFCSIALYNFIELNVIIFTTFKRWSGLYFWSFLISSNGIAPYAIGFLLKDLHFSPSLNLDIILITTGWVCMVTGQSFVLYSRLHLVMRDRCKLRLILAIIITNAIICHVPSIILARFALSEQPQRWLVPYGVYEKVEVTLFFVQEAMLSGIYIYKTLSLYRFETPKLQGGKPANKLMLHLVWVNILIIFLDITVLVLAYTNFYNIQTVMKALVYSVKLKLEFRVLNALVQLAKSGSTGSGGAARNSPPPDAVWGNRSCNAVDDDGGGGIFDGSDPRTTAVDFETLNEMTMSRMRDGPKSERAESAYGVRIFAEAPASGEHASEGAGRSGDGITVRTETEVSTMTMEDWEAHAWPSLEGLGAGSISRPVTRDSRMGSPRQSSEIEFARV